MASVLTQSGCLSTIMVLPQVSVLRSEKSERKVDGAAMPYKNGFIVVSWSHVLMEDFAPYKNGACYKVAYHRFT